MRTLKPAPKYLSSDGLFCFNGPVTRYMENTIGTPKPIYKGGHRAGPVFIGKEVGMYGFTVCWASDTEDGFMNVIEQLKENYSEVENLWGGYKEQLKEFRSSVKNDVTSLEAAARKTTEAVQRMQAAYGNVIQTLNSAEMKQATDNAERLATAMSSLANLQSHKLSIAVVDNAPACSESAK